MSRLEMEGMIQRLRKENIDLATQANMSIRAIKDALALSAVTPIDQIDADTIDAAAAQLSVIRDEYIANRKKIEALRKELDG